MKKLAESLKQIVGWRFLPKLSRLPTFILAALLMSQCEGCLCAVAGYQCPVGCATLSDSMNPGDDFVTTDRDTPVTINLLDNDDLTLENEPIHTCEVADPAHGDVVLMFNSGNETCSLLYTPEEGYIGTDSFTYTVCIICEETEEAINLSCASAAVTVTIVGLDAVDDSATTEQDTPVAIDVLANDIASGSAAPTVTGFTDPTSGSVTDDGGGVLTYTPDDGFLGDDSFTYSITSGQDTDTATVTVAVEIPPDVITPGEGGGPVLAANMPPDAVDDSATTHQVTPVTIDVLANDSDPDGDPLTVDGFTDPANGLVTDNGDGTLTYEPDSNYWEAVDSFTYTISDGQGGTAIATVTIHIELIPTPGPVITTEIFDVFDCVPIGGSRFEWYTVEVTYIDGVAVSSVVLSGPHYGYWVPGCPPDPGEPPERGDPCEDAYCGNGVCEPDCGESIDTCDDDCSP